MLSAKNESDVNGDEICSVIETCLEIAYPSNSE